jgi:hypothetical protein
MLRLAAGRPDKNPLARTDHPNSLIGGAQFWFVFFGKGRVFHCKCPFGWWQETGYVYFLMEGKARTQTSQVFNTLAENAETPKTTPSLQPEESLVRAFPGDANLKGASLEKTNLRQAIFRANRLVDKVNRRW